MQRAQVAVMLVLLSANPTAADEDPCTKEREKLASYSGQALAPWGGFVQGELAAARKDLRDCEQRVEQERQAALAKEARARQEEERARLAKHREQERAEAEEERLRAARDQAAKEADEESKNDAIRTNPKAMGAIFGAEFCLAGATKKWALDEIAKEKKYSKLGGVQNNLKLLQLQNTIRRVDEFIAKEQKDLRTAPNLKGVRPLPCTHESVKLLVRCKLDNEAERCSEGPVSRMITFVASPTDEEEDD